MENNNYLISVIIPVYNVRYYLQNCLNSVLNSTFKQLDIILVDDGSTDNSGSLCDDYLSKDTRIRVIHKENGGLSSARNAGIKIAKGDYIFFLDSDDWVGLDFFEKLVSKIKQSKADVVCCNYIRVNKDGNSAIQKEEKFDKDNIIKNILLDEYGSEVWKYISLKKLWDNVEFYEKRLYEDIPVTYKIFNSANNIEYVDDAVYYYRYNENSITNSFNPLKSYHIYLGFVERMKFAENHYPELYQKCISLSLVYAISTYFYYCGSKSKEAKSIANESFEFMKTNIKKRAKINRLNIGRIFLIYFCLYANHLFRLLAFIYRKIKNIHIEERL